MESAVQVFRGVSKNKKPYVSAKVTTVYGNVVIESSCLLKDYQVVELEANGVHIVDLTETKQEAK